MRNEIMKRNEKWNNVKKQWKEMRNEIMKRNEKWNNEKKWEMK